MIVVSDTSPINYLLLIDFVSILPQLFDRVAIPQAVYEELNHQRTPVVVRQWIVNHPDWVEVHRIQAPDVLLPLGRGEREAIALAEFLSANALLIDDDNARKKAEERGLVVTGTLGILDRAARRELISLSDALDRLRQTSFRASPKLMQSMLEEDAERKRSQKRQAE